MASLPPPQKYRAFTAGSAGSPVRPLVGGKLYTYEAGTNTPKVTYTDATESTANANPVILNSRGEADVWLGMGSYKFLLTDSTGVTESVTDGIKSSGQYLQEALDASATATGTLRSDLANSLLPTKGAGMIGFRHSLAYPAGTAGAKLRESISVLDFGAVADGNAATGAGTDNLAAFQAALAYAVANRLSVYVPAGVYILSGQLQVPTNVRLHGAGMYCSILIAKNTFTTGSGLVYCNGVGGPPTIVEHLAILGQTSTGAGTGSCGINAAANAVVLQHLWVGGFTNPFQFSGTDGIGFDLWADVPLASGYGFVVSNGGNTLSDIVSFNSYTGIYIDSTGYWSTSEPDIGVTIDGADIIQSGYSGITMVNALNTTISNTRIHSPTSTGKFTRDMITVTDGANITLNNVQGTFGNSISTTCAGIRQTGTTQNLKVQGCSMVGADFGYLFNNIPFAQVQGNSARNCRTWGFRVIGESAGLSMQGNQSQFNGTSPSTDGGGYWLSNSSGSGKWLITGNSAGDFGSTSKYGFYVDANASASAKISLGMSAVTNTATAYTIVGTPANVTQTANI